MKTRLITVAALLSSTVSAGAVSLDRSGQSITPLFLDGNQVQLSFGFTDPSIDGQNQAALGGAPIENVAENFVTAGLAIKYQFNEKLSFAFIVDEPYGSDTFYVESPVFSTLGGTGATVDSTAYTALGRYKFNDAWSVHGGIRYQEISAGVTIGGLAFNTPGTFTPGTATAVNGYSGNFGSDGAFGYVIGGAYEKPDIALRVALTYNSGTTHDLPTLETLRGTQISLPGATTEVETPESINLDFQTGIAPNTLLFGNVRYARYSDTDVQAAGFFGATGSSLTDLEDGFDFSIGIGRRFNEKWSGSISAGFSTEGDDDLISPLAPTNGSQFIAIGGKYDVNESFAIAGGVRYTFLGDAIAAPGDNPVADFESNDAVSVGLRFEYAF
ncbi:OmpP1/FadL family transporter [Tateyamaria sp.]|uniref:OmpP1/FadL family transporter n=1 Tax=Tateyamaria sp. TaxID=1929288 RepID=UPI00329B6755